MVKITEKALSEYSKILDDVKKENKIIYYLKIQKEDDKKYSMYITNIKEDDDILIVYSGINIIYNKKLQDSLENFIIDFKEGFLINCRNSCNCDCGI